MEISKTSRNRNLDPEPILIAEPTLIPEPIPEPVLGPNLIPYPTPEPNPEQNPKSILKTDPYEPTVQNRFHKNSELVGTDSDQNFMYPTTSVVHSDIGHTNRTHSLRNSSAPRRGAR